MKQKRPNAMYGRQALFSHVPCSDETSTSSHLRNSSKQLHFKMSSLRPQHASRLLQPLRSPQRYVAPLQCRYASYSSNDRIHKDSSAEPSPKADAGTSPAPTSGDSAMIRQEDSKEAMVGHQPNFRAPIDHGTSYVRLDVGLNSSNE